LFNRELEGNILYLIERLHSCQPFTPWLLLLGEEKRAWRITGSLEAIFFI
jgi:hypothetical protein